MTRKYIKNCTGERCEKEGFNANVVSMVVFYVLLLYFIGVSVYIIFFSQYLQIVNINVVGTQELDGQEVTKIVVDSLQGKYFNIISKDNFLFISQKKIEDLLTEKFKKIRSVNVIKKFPDTVDIDVDERKALLVWCSGEKCYLLDEKGTAYSEADFSSPELVQNNLLQINDTSGREVVIGSDVISPAYERYVLSLKDALNELGFEATGKYATPSRMAEEISVKTAQESDFYFSTQFELSSALKTLATVLKKEIPADKKNDIAYIDLRNENKAFYRFKINQPTMENSAAATAVK